MQRLSSENLPKRQSVFTPEGAALYHTDTIVTAMDICIPALYSTPLEKKKANRLLARAWNRDARSVELMRQKWGYASIQKEPETTPKAKENNVRRDALVDIAIRFANENAHTIHDWAKGGDGVLPAVKALSKIAEENLLRHVPEKVMRHLLESVGAIERPIPVDMTFSIPAALSSVDEQVG